MVGCLSVLYINTFGGRRTRWSLLGFDLLPILGVVLVQGPILGVVLVQDPILAVGLVQG